MTQRNRPPIQTRDFEGAPALKRPLNDALGDIYARLDALEALAGLVVLPPVVLQTAGVVGPLLAPFPLMLATPADFTPKGLVILKAENLTVPSIGFSTTGHFVYWDPGTEADGRLIVRLISGLATNTQYRFLLGALRGN